MAMNRVQFQAGLSIMEFFEQYETEPKCQRTLGCRAGRLGLRVRAAAPARRVASCAGPCRTGSVRRAAIRPACRPAIQTSTHHAFAFAKYAHRYLAEFQCRFNRRFDMPRLLPRLLYALATAPASPERILRLAEVRR